MTFAGRTAIVTGGASGIGGAVAEQLVARHAAVVIADANGDGAAGVAEALSKGGGRTLAIETDVTDPAAVARMVADTVAAFGSLDILVHSAGIGVERAFLDTTLEEWRRVVDVDLTGTFVTGQAAAREMVKAGYGRIVNLASTAGVRGSGLRAAYGAAKAGVINLTQVMAVELASRGVTVNALAPAATETDMVRQMHSPETRAIFEAAIPLGRYGQPAEIAAAALFLASEEASYVTGHVLAVDGGYSGAGLIYRDTAT